MDGEIDLLNWSSDECHSILVKDVCFDKVRVKRGVAYEAGFIMA